MGRLNQVHERMPAAERRSGTARDAGSLAVGYAMRRWAVPTDIAMPAEVEVFEPLGHPAHYRIHTAQDYARGHYEFCGLSDGFFVHVSDITHLAPHRMSVSAPDMLRVRIASTDDCEYRPADSRSDLLLLRGPNVALIIEPSNQRAAEAIFDGHTVATNVYIHRSALKRLYNDRECELPTDVQAFVAGTLDRTITQALPLGPTLLRCLEDLNRCELEGHGRRLFIRAKAIEILCHTFRQLAQKSGASGADTSAPTRRGVLKAQQLLVENFVTPSSLDVLAHAVGLSRSGLCSGFRQIVGLTVFEYIAELRMRHALTLLGRREGSITQIAYEVGYSHPSSFSLAVQRRFGSTPSELRRRGLPGI